MNYATTRLNGCSASCNAPDYSSVIIPFLCDRLCVRNKAKDVNTKLLKMVIGLNVPKSSVKPILHHYKCYVDDKKQNVNKT